jgi:hypothetical protein
MQINVTIVILPGESTADLAGNSEELADAFLIAAGGNHTKDVCTVFISDSSNVGVSQPPPS